MKLPSLSLGILFLPALGTLLAQNSGGGPALQLPIGQTFRNFSFPVYQGGVLKFQLNAAAATGITQNRAATTDVKIDIYDNGVSTTTITSPQADLYVTERKLRTKNTVLISRSDMDATAQVCDFDMMNKKYVLRTNVRVVLKDFDAGSKAVPGGLTGSGAMGVPAPQTSALPIPAPPPPRPPRNNDSLLDSPGAYSSTNSAPLSPLDMK